MKVKSRGILAATALASVAGLLLAGCSGTPSTTPPKDGGTLTVWVDSDRAGVIK